MSKSTNSTVAPAARKTTKKATANVMAELAAEIIAQPVPEVVAEVVAEAAPAAETVEAPAAEAPDAVFAATLAAANAMLANMTAEQLLAFVNGKAAKAPKAPRAPKAKAEGESTSSRVGVAGFAKQLAEKLAENPVVTLTVADRIALGLSNSAVVHRAYWAPCNPGGRAVHLANATVKAVKNGEGFDIVVTRAA